jgi:hypothetical protein
VGAVEGRDDDGDKGHERKLKNGDGLFLLF